MAFTIGVAVMAGSAWRGQYVGLAAAATCVLVAIARVGWRVVRGLRPGDIAFGASLSRSAWWLEGGIVVIVASHLAAWSWFLPIGGILVAMDIRAFFTEVRAIVRQRLPPPAARRAPDRVGVPALAVGLALHVPALTAVASLALLIGVAGTGAHLVLMLRRARGVIDPQ